MPPLKLSILGDYWDAQIYRGKLYLWHLNGDLSTYDWNKFVRETSLKLPSPLAFELAFAQGDALYRGDYLRSHREFRSWIHGRISSLHGIEFVFDSRDMYPYRTDSQGNPFGDLPGDAEVYNRKIYAVTDSGLWSATFGGRTKHSISTRPQKMWDAPLLGVRAKNQRLALAAGDEGVFEYALGEESTDFPLHELTPQVDRYVHHLATSHCSQAEWEHSSIFASSAIGEGYLVGFAWESVPIQYESSFSSRRRRFVSCFNQSEMFGPNSSRLSYTWGADGKVYGYDSSGAVSGIQFTQKELMNHPDKAFKSLGVKELQGQIGPVSSAGVTNFGTIIEFDERLVVETSDDETHIVDGPVTRWRVYPRATLYENHLHVILDDRIDILAFTNDYFLDQSAKFFGTEYRSSVGRARSGI